VVKRKTVKGGAAGGRECRKNWGDRMGAIGGRRHTTRIKSMGGKQREGSPGISCTVNRGTLKCWGHGKQPGKKGTAKEGEGYRRREGLGHRKKTVFR